MLWGRSGNRCAYGGCEQPLSVDAEGGGIVLGEEAHIVARERGGPRGISSLTLEERDSLENLILLCPNHHTLVDKDPATHTVELLLSMKRDHEEAVMAAEPPAVRDARRADETYAGYIDEWAAEADLAHWEDWTSYLMFGARPSLARERYVALERLRHWLLRRIWPGLNPQLEDALHNFRFVLDDLLRTFLRAADDNGEEMVTRPYYKIDRWDPKAYDRLLDDYKHHVALVENLTLELTRAGNFICDRVRESLDPRFRLEEGALTISAGLNPDFTYQVVRPEYRATERDAARPYPGMKEFQRIVTKRDFSLSPSDF